MVTRLPARALLVLVVLFMGVVPAERAVWWLLDTGPLASEPELVLNGVSAHGAVRVFGDHPGLEPAAAARLTVDQLTRDGGFDRSVLVVTVPTGSGWVDPDQVEALERWAGGDIATVALRYSSAPSAAVYLLRPDSATRAARALLTEVAGRLRTMDGDDQPQLVVHGLSLGALAGATALTDPSVAGVVDTALWQGLPGAHATAGGSDGSRAPGRADRCTVWSVNADDPVAELSWGLLRDLARAVRVLAALPGSDSSTPGTGHRYRPLVPPAGCVT
ncbi:hypothetical protein ES5_02524 [Dietzia cinnamea P4]|nr:hypothetical protein ES5_02524 [Dietzia cinnamea P4]OAH55677.1 hypothetical protein AYJ66_15430 [Dietzia cinnamea]